MVVKGKMLVCSFDFGAFCWGFGLWVGYPFGDMLSFCEFGFYSFTDFDTVLLYINGIAV